MQAYRRKLLGFDAGSRKDDRWKLKETLLLSSVERDNLVELHKLVHLGSLSPNKSDKAKKHYYRIVELLCPYMDLDKGVELDADALMKAWEEVYGSLDDPETQQGIEDTINSLRSQCGL